MNTSNLYNKLQEGGQLITESSSDQWDERFEEVTCSLHYSHKFDDTNDVSTTYLGRCLGKEEPRTFPVDNHIPFDGRGVLKAYLSNGTPMKMFFDSGASRSYLSKRFYDANPMLHDMPKYVTTCTGIRIGNGSIVPALFVIPILFMACGHTFEMFTIVAEIDDDMDLVFGFKNMVETEGLLNTRTGEFDFIGRSIPIFPQNDLDVRPGEKVYVNIKAPFCDKLSGMICAKFFSRDVVNTLRIKIQDNQGVVQFVNNQDEIVHLRKEKAVGILDLRSVGYFKVGYQRMVNMAESSKVFRIYHYQQVKSDTGTEVDQYMRITGKYRAKGSMSQINEEGNVERHKKDDPYPWLTKDDPRRFQSDEEILYEKIDLSDSAMSRKEKSRLMKMLIKYRDTFSLRDEIGECPNLKADIKVIDESPFFVRPFPISENDKPFMDEQMERLVSLGILSKNSTSHTSPVMLITRKMTKDKRPVVDFRLLNTRILRRNTSIKRPYQKRINLNVPAMTKISMDIKQMPVNKGYSHILVLLCEVTNYMVALPLMSTRTPHILEAFQRGYLAYFGPPTHIVCDQDPAFTSSLMEAFVTQLNIKVILVSPTNHQSLQVEHGIKSLSGLLVKHLSTVWSWHSVLPYSMLCYNGYSSPNLNGYSPYELVFGHKMTLSHDLEIKVDTVVSGTFKEYYEKLKRNLQYMGERLQRFRSQRLDLLNKDREYQAFEVGQIVYMFQARGSVIETGSRKIRCNYIGPLAIFKAVGPNQFLLMSLDGLIYPHLIEQSRLKAGTIWTTKGNVNNLADLRKALSTGLSIGAN